MFKIHKYTFLSWALLGLANASQLEEVEEKVLAHFPQLPPSNHPNPRLIDEKIQDISPDIFKEFLSNFKKVLEYSAENQGKKYKAMFLPQEKLFIQIGDNKYPLYAAGGWQLSELNQALNINQFKHDNFRFPTLTLTINQIDQMLNDASQDYRDFSIINKLRTYERSGRTYARLEMYFHNINVRMSKISRLYLPTLMYILKDNQIAPERLPGNPQTLSSFYTNMDISKLTDEEYAEKFVDPFKVLLQFALDNNQETKTCGNFNNRRDASPYVLVDGKIARVLYVFGLQVRLSLRRAIESISRYEMNACVEKIRESIGYHRDLFVDEMDTRSFLETSNTLNYLPSYEVMQIFVNQDKLQAHSNDRLPGMVFVYE